MKFNLKSKPVIITALFLLCCCVLVCSFTLSRRILPRAVCYSVNTSEHGISHIMPKTTEPLKENISEIQSDGPFIIKKQDNGVYVFLDGKTVYKVRTNLSQLTERDRQKLDEGIEIFGKSNLYEAVLLMES